MNKDNMSKFKKVIYFVFLFHIIMCLLQQLGFIGSFNSGKYIYTLHQGRLTSTFNGSYELGAFIVILSIWFMYETFYNKNKKILNIICLFVCLVLVYACESRISFIVFIILFIIMFLKRYFLKIKEHIFLFSTIFFEIALIGIILWYSPFIRNSRFSSISINEYIESIKCAWQYKNFDNYITTGNWYGNDICVDVGTDVSFNMRFNHWAQLLDGFKKSPIFGLGTSVTTVAADGNYIRILTESGIIGFISYVYVMYLVIKELSRKNSYNIIVKYCLYSVLIGSLMIDLLEASKIMMSLWFIIGMVICKNEEDKKCNNCK